MAAPQDLQDGAVMAVSHERAVIQKMAHQTDSLSNPAVVSTGGVWVLLAIGCCISFWLLIRQFRPDNSPRCPGLLRRLWGSWYPTVPAGGPVVSPPALVYLDASRVSPEAATEFRRALQVIAQEHHRTVLSFSPAPLGEGYLPVHPMPAKCDRDPLPDFAVRLYVEMTPELAGNSPWPAVVYRDTKIKTEYERTLAAVQVIFNQAVRRSGPKD
jgi:hypothetical protein